MKKIILFLLLVTLSLSLCACNTTPVDTGADAHDHEHIGETVEPSGETEDTPTEDTPTEDPVPMGEDAPAPSIDPERLEAAVSDEPAIPMPENRPEDFAVYFEWGVMEGNFLDSYNNKVGRDMVGEEDITADYTLSDTQLDEIYAALVQYKIAHIRTEMTYDNIAGQEGGMDVSPNTRYLVRFRVDGREYTVKGDVTASFCDAGRDYEAFNTTLADMTVRIWRELKIPEPTSAYC